MIELRFLAHRRFNYIDSITTATTCINLWEHQWLGAFITFSGGTLLSLLIERKVKK